MAGETVKAQAICLSIHPWSRTSHVTGWLTEDGCVTTVVRGAERPKSAFLGQYDLNYTCDLVYYARARGNVHALRECVPVERRDGLRESYRAMALSDWFRLLARELTPTGPEARRWFETLARALDELAAIRASRREEAVPELLSALLAYELEILELAGLMPDFAVNSGFFQLRGERNIPISPAVAACIKHRGRERDPKILVDAARAIGVFYSFHLDCAPEVRRTVLRIILQ